MKYLAGHDSGLSILQDHSRQGHIFLHFYFDYRAGEKDPNSLEGLLRSILYQLVAANNITDQAVRQLLNGLTVTASTKASIEAICNELFALHAGL